MFSAPPNRVSPFGIIRVCSVGHSRDTMLLMIARQVAEGRCE
jgi:hypothetical protein